MKVVVLTTSYPRFPGDSAGVFVADAVDAMRQRGIDIDVVSPTSFRHFGIAYGHGILGNLKAAPWKLALVPAFLVSYALAARRASRDADLVHAHWLPSTIAALATGKPFVVQLWGSDVVLARRARWVCRALVARARFTICASASLSAGAHELGVRRTRVIAAPVAIPAEVAEPSEPAHVLYAGRLSAEKGILEFVRATEGLPRVIVGEGPIVVPESQPFVPREELYGFYADAAVVCVPSHREGYGMVVREAMAHGRPVVATAVGGIADAIVDGESGLLVAAGDEPALREAIVRLLADASLRRRLGAAARERVRRESEPASSALASAYEEALT